MTLSTLARSLTALVLLAPALAVTAAAPAQAADPAYPFKDDTVQLVDRPGWSADLLTSPDGASSRLSGTINSTVAQEYGLTTAKQTDVPDGLRRSWVEDSKYADAPNLAGADSSALGYLDEDDSLDAVYLVKGDGGGADTLYVTASQKYGFPVRDQLTLAPGALSVTTTERSASQPAYVWIRYADRLEAWQALTDPDREGTLGLVPVTVTNNELGSHLDLFHHGTWLDQGRTMAQALGVRQTSFATLIDTGGAQDNLRAVMRKVASHTDATGDKPGTVTLGVVYDWSADNMTTPAGRSWLPDSGRVRYTWPDRDGALFGGFQDIVSYSLVMSARSADASGGNQHNRLYEVTRMSDRPELWAATVDDGTQCGDDTALEIDVAHQKSETVVGCSSVDVNGNADRLVQNIARVPVFGGTGAWAAQHSNPVNDEPTLGALHPRVVFPCVALLAQASKGCSTTSGTAGNAAIETTLAGDVDTNRPDLGYNYGNSYRTSDAWLDKVASKASNPGRFLWSPLASRGSVTPSTPLLVTPLPLQRNQLQVEIPEGQVPVQTRSEPIPIAYLSAPPQVAGSGQEGDAPEFAATSSSGQGSTTTTASRVGVHVGAEYEDPLGANGASFELSLQSEVTDEKSLERTITTAQAYRGLVDDDVVVYRTIPSEQWRGTVVSSSTGLGFDTQISVDFPTDGIVTSAASVTSLARKYPALFGADGQLKPVLDQVFDHEVGDPGSYKSYAADNDGPAGAQVDGYCDGSLSAGGDRQLKTFDTLVPGNPYLAPTPVPPQPDILVSDRHDVQTGTSNAEGATFGIENSQTNSRVQTTSIDLDVSGKAGYFQAGVTGGFTWGEGWTSTLSDGAEFSSFVGNIPSDDPALETETYNWRSFLCQKTVSDSTGAPLNAWVLDYTVDGYAGSGGLAPVTGLRADGPIDSATTDPAATVLRWTRDRGTVKAYDWRVEAIGATDTRSGQISFATPKQATATDTASHAVPVGGAPLLPGQLYRWKTTATDFVGGGADTDWQYFVTSAPAAGPSAVADRFSATEDTALTLDVLANDTNPAGGPLTLSIAEAPVNGTATVVDGKVRYEPRRNRCGVDTFDYRSTDADGRSTIGTVILRVACVNDRPVAVNDRFRLRAGDRTLEVNAPGVLGNDRDADRDDLTPKLIRAPQGVDVELGDSGRLEVTVRKAAAPRGNLSIRYRACDEDSCSDVANVTVVR